MLEIELLKQIEVADETSPVVPVEVEFFKEVSKYDFPATVSAAEKLAQAGFSPGEVGELLSGALKYERLGYSSACFKTDYPLKPAIGELLGEIVTSNRAVATYYYLNQPEALLGSNENLNTDSLTVIGPQSGSKAVKMTIILPIDVKELDAAGS